MKNKLLRVTKFGIHKLESHATIIYSNSVFCSEVWQILDAWQ